MTPPHPEWDLGLELLEGELESTVPFTGTITPTVPMRSVGPSIEAPSEVNMATSNVSTEIRACVLVGGCDAVIAAELAFATTILRTPVLPERTTMLGPSPIAYHDRNRPVLRPGGDGLFSTLR